MVDSTNVKQNFAEKIRSLKFPITIEPLVCLYTISVGLNEVILLGLLQTEESFSTIHIANSKPRLNERSDKMEPGTIKAENAKLIYFQVIRSNLIIDKICQDKLNLTAEVCSQLNLPNNTDQQLEVQQHVTDYEALYSSISFAPK